MTAAAPSGGVLHVVAEVGVTDVGDHEHGAHPGTALSPL